MIIQPRLMKKGKPLASCTWQEIDQASQNGTAKTLWKVEDTIDIELTGTYAQTLTLEILDFDHDDLADGGKAGITFGCKNLMNNSKRLHSANNNTGGYGVTEMHTITLPEILDCFPVDLKSLIKIVNKKTSKGNTSTELEDIPCKLFLFSENELFGEIYYSAGNEGTRYPKFTDNESRIKKMRNGAGASNYYWERSPSMKSSMEFCNASSDGSSSQSFYPSNTVGVAFGFCI